MGVKYRVWCQHGFENSCGGYREGSAIADRVYATKEEAKARVRELAEWSGSHWTRAWVEEVEG